jgi:AcrR family transcriptional regulator
MSSQTHELRREAQRDLARRAILDATEALLLESDRDDFSIRRLVERCGYAAPSIYHYFGDKEGLLDALIEERFAKLNAELKQVPRDSPVALIRGLTTAFVRFCLQHPTHFKLLFTPRAQDHRPPPSGDEARKLFEDALLSLWEAGRLRHGDAATAGQALWVLCHGLVWSQIARPEIEWSKTLTEDSIDALLRGLVAPHDDANREGGVR